MKRILIGLFAFLSVSNAYAMTYDKIITQIRIDLRDTGPAASQYRYSTSTIYNAISAIEEEMIDTVEPEAMAGRYSTTTVADQRAYRLPTDIMGLPTRVAYYNTSSTSTFKRLQFYYIAGKDTDVKTWEATTSGLPKRYMLRGNNIELDPIPNGSYSTTTWNCLRIDYIKDPTDPDATRMSSEPFNGSQQLKSYSKHIIPGVVGMLGRDNTAKQEYYTQIGKMKTEVHDNKDFFKTREPNR